MAVELRGIHKRFGSTDALRDVNLEVGEREFFSILGPSGCGKSTLLRIIAGLERPDAGVVRIGGVDVSGREPNERGIGMVFQNYALFPHLTAADNIGFGLKGKVSKRELAARVAEIAELLDLEESMLARRPRQLSGGQRQRVALGRALIRRPPVLLMDEPLSGADALLRERMRGELRRFHERAGTTTIYVTHDQREALSMSDQLAVLDKGRVQQAGRPIDVYRSPSTVFAARFVGSPGMSTWPMRLSFADGRPRLRGLDGCSWPMPDLLETDVSEVTVGVRAERMRLEPDQNAVCRLSCHSATIEPQGETVLVRALYGQEEIVALAGVEEVGRLGADVEIWIAPEDLHVFEHATGRRLSARRSAGRKEATRAAVAR